MGAKYAAGCILKFPGKLAVQPGVGVTRLTISKFPSLRNPPSSFSRTSAAAFQPDLPDFYFKNSVSCRWPHFTKYWYRMRYQYFVKWGHRLKPENKKFPNPGIRLKRGCTNPPEAAVQPGTHLLLNNLNIVESEILWNPLSILYFLDSWGSQQSKERIITGAGLVQAGKSYRVVRTGEFNCWT